METKKKTRKTKVKETDPKADDAINDSHEIFDLECDRQIQRASMNHGGRIIRKSIGSS